MDIFVILHYHMCDDSYYGYRENFIRVHESFEKAKTSVDAFLAKQSGRTKWDGKKGNSFVCIVKTKMGENVHETVFDSCEPDSDS